MCATDRFKSHHLRQSRRSGKAKAEADGSSVPAQPDGDNERQRLGQLKGKVEARKARPAALRTD